ncbi:MAG TPA: DUF202 domain-containing protein [Terriglobales bacterium]
MMTARDEIQGTQGGAEEFRADLAAQRTELALDRTQLAWARTVLSLIAAGVALDKGLKLLHDARVVAGNAFVRNAHGAGLALTGISTGLLIISAADYWHASHKLSRAHRSIGRWLPPPLFISLLVILLGIIVFIILLGDTGP